MLHIQRREFITLMGGGAAAWPLAARAQQAGLAVIGFLDSTMAADSAYRVDAFRRGLAETGYLEGQNLGIEYRWAKGRPSRASPCRRSDHPARSRNCCQQCLR